jgi:hypothetical protein
VCGLHQTYHGVKNPFGRSSDEAEVEAHFVRVKIVLILTQDSCIVYAECTIGSEIVVDTPDRTPW